MKKKILALCLVVVLVVTAITGVTLAYFTDTDTVENTFTMGKVDILLDETETNNDGKGNIVEKHKNRTDENDYTETNMVPGHVFDKDPTIHVMKGSEDSYIFLDMNFNKYSSLFWVMAADAADDKDINLPLYAVYGEGDEKAGQREIRVDETTGEEYYVLADEFKNDRNVFSTTKMLEYLVEYENRETMRKIIDKWFTGIKHENWEICDIIMKTGEHETYVTFRFAYKGDNDRTAFTVNAKDIDKDCIDIEFMQAFQMPASVTQRMISDGKDVGNMANAFNTTIVYDKDGKEVSGEEFHLNFKAYAIQADEMNEVKNDDGEVTKKSWQVAYEALFGVVLDEDLVQLNKDLVEVTK